MKPLLIVAAITGAMVSFAIPLPRPVSPAAKAPVSENRKAASHPAPAFEPDPQVDAASVPALSASECGAALDRLLRRTAVALPDADTFDAAVALTLRLAELTAATNPPLHPLRTRRLPSWLLQGATRSFLEKSPRPPAAWMTAVSQSAEGFRAMTGLTAELAVSSPDRVKSLTEACPPSWRAALDEKRLEGLAVRDPMAAAREASTSSGAPDASQKLLLVSSTKGPVKETVAALALYGQGEAGGRSHLHTELVNLLQRDPEGTRAAVQESGDPLLQKLLTRVGPVSSKVEPPPGSREEIAAALSRFENPKDLHRSEALSALAALDPNEATRVWSATDSSAHSPAEGSSIVAGMGSTDPAKAFQWARANAPQEMETAFRTWVFRDGPAALQAALSLPAGDAFRDMVISVARPSPGIPENPESSPMTENYNNGTPAPRPRVHHALPFYLDDAIQGAARYVQLPAPAFSAPASSARPASGSSLWDTPAR